MQSAMSPTALAIGPISFSVPMHVNAVVEATPMSVDYFSIHWRSLFVTSSTALTRYYMGVDHSGNRMAQITLP